MRAWLLIAALAAGPAAAQTHAGHDMGGRDMGGHDMGQMDHSAHAGHAAPQAMTPDEPQPPPAAFADQPAPEDPDVLFGRQAMDRARAILAREHGGMPQTMGVIERLEAGENGAAAWEARLRYGGDFDRLVLKTEGETEDGRVHEAELQALLSHAIDPYFDVQAGVRQDLQNERRRTWAVAGVEGLAPYWFEVGAWLMVSERGEAVARAEGAYDLRITQSLILQPRAEIEADIAGNGGFSSAEAGLRLRYDRGWGIAPYVGVMRSQVFGEARDLARAAGGSAGETRAVIGLSARF